MAVAKVTVGTSMKVANPANRFENATFHRTLGIEEDVASRPDDDSPEIQNAYEEFVLGRLRDLEQRLKVEVDKMIETDIKETFE